MMKEMMDLDFLLWRMCLWEDQAFVEFDEILRELVMTWLRGFGLSDREILDECPRCLLELGILVVSRSDEIKPGHFLRWCHAEVRNLVVRYWREAESTASPIPVLTAARVRLLTDQIDGSATAYESIANRLNVSTKWLKWRHQVLLQ